MMDGEMMKLAHIVFHSIFVIASILFAYYWYKIRPEQIRTECQKILAEEQSGGADSLYVNDSSTEHSSCISELGLK